MAQTPRQPSTLNRRCDMKDNILIYSYSSAHKSLTFLHMFTAGTNLLQEVFIYCLLTLKDRHLNLSVALVRHPLLQVSVNHGRRFRHLTWTRLRE